ncbi:o-succinylbenzoate synthase [Pasteurellaceae bacterium Macca]|nr:o-succinylbenzoate synthase [Pasteurellaceae bacterium Macca]
MRTVALYRYAIPVETGVVLRHRRLKQREGLIIRLGENGREGWGEIAPLPEFSQESLAEAESQAKACLKAWRAGDPCQFDTLFPSVAFGLSFAFAELQGELGEEGNYRVAPLCYGDPDALYHKLNQIEGEKVAKMKVGLYEANRDGLLADMFLSALPDLMLRLDANRAWSLEKASQFARQISPENRHRIQFIEEPCHTPALSRQFAQTHQLAIAWDESTREPDFCLQPEPNLRGIVIKPTLVGDFAKCVALIQQAHQFGLTVVISSSIESSLGLTQLARFAKQYTPHSTPGLDTLGLMTAQLLRSWQGSSLPLIGLDSDALQAVEID